MAIGMVALAAWSVLAGTPGLADLPPGIRAVRRGPSLELRGRGLALAAGKVLLPTGPEAGERPSYVVVDPRPDGFLTRSAERELGIQASVQPLESLAVTVGAYNNKARYKPGTLVIKDALARLDLDLGPARAGAFVFLGTGRRLGDRRKGGLDLRADVGPVEFSASAVHGSEPGAAVAGWHAALSHDLSARTRMVARADSQQPDGGSGGNIESYAILALVEKLSATRTGTLNLQFGLADTGRPDGMWAVLGQLTERW